MVVGVSEMSKRVYQLIPLVEYRKEKLRGIVAVQGTHGKFV